MTAAGRQAVEARSVRARVRICLRNMMASLSSPSPQNAAGPGRVRDYQVDNDGPAERTLAKHDVLFGWPARPRRSRKSPIARC
jgi:hypothetical protein